MGLAVGVGLIAGCKNGNNSDHQHAKDMSSTSSDSMMMTAKNDKDLATMLIEHHDGAIRLSDLELKQGESADTKQIAQKIRDMQSKERQDLQRLQQQLGGAGMSMSSEMKAKQARAEQELSAAKGHDADHHFLKHMTEHHQDGIRMVQSSMPNLQNQELKGMVQKMVQDQQNDIAQMHKQMH
jgi:uncharacterized protein (DUF305 family)